MAGGYQEFAYAGKEVTKSDQVGEAQIEARHLSPGLFQQVNLVKTHTHDGVNSPQISRDGLKTMLRKAQLDVGGFTTSPGVGAWPDGATNTVYFFFVVPDDYVGSSISINILRRSSVAAGTADMSYVVYRFRNGAALVTAIGSTATAYTPGNTNSNVLTVSLTANTFALGDTLRIDLTRTGGSGGDTMAGAVDYDGGWVLYSGKA